MGRIDTYKGRYGTSYIYRVQNLYDLKSASVLVANLENIPSINVEKIKLTDYTYRMEEGNHSQIIPTNSSFEEIYQKSKEYVDFIDVTADYAGKNIDLSIDISDFSIGVTLKNEDVGIIGEIEKILKLCED